MADNWWYIMQGDWIEKLKELESESVNCVVTSPPYWGLRDYGDSGQLGAERTPNEYVDKLVEGFREVRRVLRGDGVMWLNLGDSASGSGAVAGGKWKENNTGSGGTWHGGKECTQSRHHPPDGLKEKDLVGIPWLVAFALRADGWYLRQEIIWHKPNVKPESVKDRPTRAHEQIFLFAKSPRYWYDADAIKEPSTVESVARRNRDDYRDKSGWDDAHFGNPPRGLAGKGRGGRNAFRGQGAERPNESGKANREGRDMKNIGADGMRNKRSVWTVATLPFKGAHFATFPPKLIEPCILAGCPLDGVVLDTFSGAGTSGLVSLRLGRNFIGIELKPEYVTMSENRIAGDQAERSQTVNARSGVVADRTVPDVLH